MYQHLCITTCSIIPILTERGVTLVCSLIGDLDLSLCGHGSQPPLRRSLAAVPEYLWINSFIFKSPNLPSSQIYHLSYPAWLIRGLEWEGLRCWDQAVRRMCKAKTRHVPPWPLPSVSKWDLFLHSGLHERAATLRIRFPHRWHRCRSVS